MKSDRNKAYIDTLVKIILLNKHKNSQIKFQKKEKIFVYKKNSLLNIFYSFELKIQPKNPFLNLQIVTYNELLLNYFQAAL